MAKKRPTSKRPTTRRPAKRAARAETKRATKKTPASHNIPLPQITPSQHRILTFEETPSWLHPFAQELYPEVVDELERRGRRLTSQPIQVAMFCQYLAQFRLATVDINKDGVTALETRETEKSYSETKKSHPSLKGQTEAKKAIRELIHDLGLNDTLSDTAASSVDGLSRWLDRALQGSLAAERN